ncbi:MAG TPA: DUF192 domain-containing protein [Acidimicrobiia bacterium]
MSSCSRVELSQTTATVDRTPAPPTVGQTALPSTPSLGIVPDLLAGFPLATVTLDGEQILVAVADTEQRRRQGLMGVEDLGDLEGMLFVYEEDVIVGFHMRNTPLPLDLAFFDGAGRLVGLTAMVPCREERCPTYSSPGPFRWAIEAPLGALGHLAEGALLVLDTG